MDNMQEKTPKLTKEEIQNIIDSENGKGYYRNINLKGYTFTKNRSFIIFELKTLEDIRICHIKYIHFEDEKDLINIMAYCCNFWMGNKVQFIYYKEKDRKSSEKIKDFLRSLNFRIETIDRPNWRWKFDCIKEECVNECKCVVWSFYK